MKACNLSAHCTCVLSLLWQGATTIGNVHGCRKLGVVCAMLTTCKTADSALPLANAAARSKSLTD